MQTAKPAEDVQLPKWTAESLAGLELLWRVIDSKNEIYEQMKSFGFGYTIKSTNTFKPYSMAQLDAKAKEMNFIRKEKKVTAQPPPQPPPSGEEKSGIGNELDKVVKEREGPAQGREQQAQGREQQAQGREQQAQGNTRQRSRACCLGHNRVAFLNLPKL